MYGFTVQNAREKRTTRCNEATQLICTDFERKRQNGSEYGMLLAAGGTKEILEAAMLKFIDEGGNVEVTLLCNEIEFR